METSAATASTYCRCAGKRRHLYIYTAPPHTGLWTPQAVLTADHAGITATGAQFGYSVAISADGNIVAAGALSTASYGVRVFQRTGTLWSTQGALLKGGGVTNFSFGWSLALNAAGDRLAVGAVNDNTDGISTGWLLCSHRTLLPPPACLHRHSEPASSPSAPSMQWYSIPRPASRANPLWRCAQTCAPLTRRRKHKTHQST
jgi:hypothetical protein